MGNNSEAFKKQRAGKCRHLRVQNKQQNLFGYYIISKIILFFLLRLGSTLAVSYL